MKYKIVIDSCTDILDCFRSNPNIEVVPLTLVVDEENIIDDEAFNQIEFLEKVKNSTDCPRSACPSPERYMQAYDCDADCIFVVTLSDKLSGSYNSAELAKNLFLEDHADSKITVFNSLSASAGQSLIALKIIEMADRDCSFEEISDTITAFTKEMKTFFVLETLDFLKKNGRLSKVQALLASALNIKPVMRSDGDGAIIKADQVRGMNKALGRMCDIILSELPDHKERILTITHCNNASRAEFVKAELLKRGEFKDILIANAAGVASLYAGDGGIVIGV